MKGVVYELMELLSFNADDLIVEIRAFVLPLSGIQALGDAVNEHMTQVSSGKSSE